MFRDNSEFYLIAWDQVVGIASVTSVFIMISLGRNLIILTQEFPSCRVPMNIWLPPEQTIYACLMYYAFSVEDSLDVNYNLDISYG